MPEGVIPVLVILVMVAFNALYVAAEFATVGSRRSRVQESAETDRRAAGLLGILTDPHRLDAYVAACQIGITISSLVAGAYGQARLTPLLEPHLGDAGRAVAVLIVLVAVTSLQVVLGELLPKTVALRYPERLAQATLRPMQVSQWLFRPLVAVFNGSAFAVMRRAGLTTDHSHTHVHSPDELAGLFRASAEGGLIGATEGAMLTGALEIADRKVRDIMTPRRRLVVVDGSARVAESVTTLAPTAHSRFPVVADDGTIVGVVHLRDLFARSRIDPTGAVSELARPLPVVADVLAVRDLWPRIHSGGDHMVLVVDEYGSTVGVVTAEDVVEEVVGEVHDEFDTRLDPIHEVGGRVSVSGEVLLVTLNDRYALDLPVGPADTVGGLLWHVLGRRPEVGEEVAIGPTGLTLRVDAMAGQAVDLVSFPGGGTGR